MPLFTIHPENQIDLALTDEIAHGNLQLKLSEESKKAIQSNHDFMLRKIKESKKPIYGINTGFGSLCNVQIDENSLEELQENLVKSHACGLGEIASVEITRLMLFYKIFALAKGYSGVNVALVEKLIYFYNNDLIPVVYTQGSLGASGDLAPLAHLSLPLLGLGQVWQRDKIVEVSELFPKLGIAPLTLKAKEGLALLNGTQFMSAHLAYAVFNGFKISYLSDLVASCSLVGYEGRVDAFDAWIQRVRPHKGQVQVAERMREFCHASAYDSSESKYVQDPYSFRCIPQVHGATLDTLHFVAHTLEVEINSVTDNPTLFEEAGQIISGGNFHGQPLALAADYLAIALAELGSISERRTYLLISGQRDLPAFLVKNSGLHSGLMIAQYTAASIVSQNKQLCTPASIDSIPSSNGQEDHVSMGANAVTKLIKVVENVYSILGIELINASQAMSYRAPSKSNLLIEFIDEFRKNVALVNSDRLLSPDLWNARNFLKNIEIEQKEFLPQS